MARMDRKAVAQWLLDSAAGSVAVAVPIRDRKSGTWSIVPRTVPYYAGETPADVESFAAAARASLETMRARRLAEIAAAPVVTLAPCADRGRKCYFGADKSGLHVGHNGGRDTFSTPDDLIAIERLAAELDARKGRTVRASVIPAAELAIRAAVAESEPVAPEPAPVLTVIQPRERPTCERCGQTFRKSGTGYAWHVANRPDCATRRLAVAS